MRAGMGNIVTDSATVSKSAFASTISALRKLGSKSRRSSSNSSDDTAFGYRPSVSANSDSNLDRAIHGPAQYDADLAASKIARSNALLAEHASPTQTQHNSNIAGFTGTATAGMFSINTCWRALKDLLACTQHLLACISLHALLQGVASR